MAFNGNLPGILQASKMITWVAVVFMTLNTIIEGSKILILPMHHRSHIHIFRSLGKGVAENGHDVSVLTSDKFSDLLEGYVNHTIAFPLPNGADCNDFLERSMREDPSAKNLMYDLVTNPPPEMGRYCDTFLANETLMNAVQEESFDLVIVDGSLFNECAYTIPYKYDIPYITVHTFSLVSWAAGITGMPSIEPETVLEVSNRMSFWERLENFQHWIHGLETPFMVVFDKHFLPTYVPEKPLKSFKDIMRDSEMFLMNYEIYCLDYPRVSAPNYQFLGPSSVDSPKPLQGKLQEFVEGAEHGIVVMSIGSFNAWKHIWLILNDKIFPAFGQLKQKVIVQYNFEQLPKMVPENVMLMNFIPQIDLLAHPKTKLFVSHGGNNGQNEAVYFGVPMLVIAITADQPYAGIRTVSHGYGHYVRNKETVTSEELLTMMEDVIYNETYANNIKKCSRIVQSVPSAKENFVFWVNHILQFGGSHLRPPSMDMPLYQVLMLDIVAYYVGLGVLFLHCTIAVVYIICRYAYRKIKENGSPLKKIN